MKSILFICILLGVFVSFTSAQLLTEDFNYTSGDLLTNDGWTQTGTSSTNPITVSTSGLSYASYLNSGIGNAAALTNNGQDINKAFASQNAGSVYASCLVNLSAVQTTGDYFFHFLGTSTTSLYCRTFAKDDGLGNVLFGISKNNGTNASHWPSPIG